MADTEFDPNKVAAEVVLQATERVVSATAEPLRTGSRRLLQAISNAYSPFLEKTLVRVSTIRTFLKPTESVDLLDHYVPVDLTNKVDDIAVEDVITGLFAGERYIISGLAGRGKSVLMRYIALSMYHAPRGRIPLFLELRNLNNLTSKNLLQLIHSQYKGESNVSFGDFTEALRKGYFVLILDGFDEISPQDREAIESQIIDLSFTYEKVSIILSGRPYERFAAWERFRVLHLKPMTFTQTKKLIHNSIYDDDVKKVFLKRLTADFFKKHESFLNTPLLAIMLMLTFEEYAEIPASLHEFYRNAFDTLIRRHDAMKAQFLRQTHSGCTAEEFKKIFSSFCLLTYSKSVFTFARDEISEYLEMAIKQQKLRYSKEKVLEDLIESICLLQEEGFEISFVHRSFQEYFCALFVSTAPAGLVKKYIDSGKFRVQDDVIPMLFGMVPERVEIEWANDTVKNICDRFPKDDLDCDWKFAIEMYPEVEVMPSHDGVGPILMHDSELASTIEVVRRMYPAHFVFISDDGKRKRTEEERNKWRDSTSEEVKKLEDSGDIQFRGFKDAVNALKSGKDERGIFKIKLDSSHQKFICAVYGDSFNGFMPALRAIQKDQRARARGADQFLREVFSA